MKKLRGGYEDGHSGSHSATLDKVAKKELRSFALTIETRRLGVEVRRLGYVVHSGSIPRIHQGLCRETVLARRSADARRP